jgi:membrane-anchored protein YejM (alkaline phosphatase superfamily)
LTEEWLEWIEKRRTARPFFGFLYYDAVVSIEPPEDYPLPVPAPPGAPEQARLNALYLGAVRYDDSLIGKVLDDLTRRNLLDRTIIIVTSDHGMEFDENGLGFTGHATSYSDYQIRAPLLIRWPGRPPSRVIRRTSHYDVVPTLLTHLFGCTNSPSDYASGQDLFSDTQWNWLITASYRDFALIDPERVILILPGGYEIRDRTYRLVSHPILPREALRSAVREMSRFYR